jgi:hypothetical protein
MRIQAGKGWVGVPRPNPIDEQILRYIPKSLRVEHDKCCKLAHYTDTSMLVLYNSHPVVVL